MELKMDNQEIITKWQDKIKRGFLWIAILKLYSEKVPLSGTDLKSKISEFHHNWDPSPGSIYPILKKMNDDSLITQIEDNDRKNKVYVITDLGSELLTALRNDVFAFRMHPFEILKRMGRNESEFKEKFKKMHQNLTPVEVIAFNDHFKKILYWFEESIKDNV